MLKPLTRSKQVGDLKARLDINKPRMDVWIIHAYQKFGIVQSNFHGQLLQHTSLRQGGKLLPSKLLKSVRFFLLLLFILAFHREMPVVVLALKKKKMI